MQKSFTFTVNLFVAWLHSELWVGVWWWDSALNDFLCCCCWCLHRMSHSFKRSCPTASTKAVRTCGSANWSQSNFSWPASTLKWQRGISPTLWSRKARLWYLAKESAKSGNSLSLPLEAIYLVFLIISLKKITILMYFILEWVANKWILTYK